jgi:hypothetical protein
MGEVSKRCKNQWMRWTTEGLEAILQLRLVKYADPKHYQSFLDKLLQRSIKTAMSCDLSVESTRGKLQTALRHDRNIAPLPFVRMSAVSANSGIEVMVFQSAGPTGPSYWIVIPSTGSSR